MHQRLCRHLGCSWLWRRDPPEWKVFESVCPALAFQVPAGITRYQKNAIEMCMQQFMIAYRPSGYCHIHKSYVPNEIYSYLHITITLDSCKRLDTLTVDDVGIILLSSCSKLERRKFKTYKAKFCNANIDGKTLENMTEDRLRSIGITSKSHRRRILDRARKLILHGYPICNIRAYIRD